MDDLHDRVAAIERTLSEGERDPAALTAGAAAPEHVSDLEGGFGALREEVDEFAAATQALRIANPSGVTVSNAVAVRADLEGVGRAFRVAAIRALTRHGLGDRRRRAAVVAAALERWAGP